MNSMSSESIGSGGQTADRPRIRSCQKRSRPSFIAIGNPPRRTTTTCRTPGVPSSASSANVLSGTSAPRRNPPSAVTRTVARASLMRSRSDSAENPPNTTLCTAPMRAQASMAIASSGMSGR